MSRLLCKMTCSDIDVSFYVIRHVLVNIYTFVKHSMSPAAVFSPISITSQYFIDLEGREVRRYNSREQKQIPIMGKKTSIVMGKRDKQLRF